VIYLVSEPGRLDPPWLAPHGFTVTR